MYKPGVSQRASAVKGYLILRKCATIVVFTFECRSENGVFNWSGAGHPCILEVSMKERNVLFYS